MTKKTSKKKKAKVFTKGEANKIVDSAIHPLFKKNEGFRIIDGVIHGFIEKDPPSSLKKFIKYNFPEIIDKTIKKLLK